MAKKTAIEYEAMIGGLMRRIDDLENKHDIADFQWSQWKQRAEDAERRLKDAGIA